MTSADVLIVTALGLERAAIRSHLHDVTTEHVAPAQVDLGNFATSVGQIRIAVLEVGPGNIDAAVLTALTTTQLGQQATLMVGIGGGLKDVRLGDVVASSKIYWFESGKSTSDGVKSRTTTGEVSVQLVQVARQIASGNGWRERRIPASDLDAAAIVAPILAGERVIASTSSADAERISRDFSDAAAVAMEDVGVAAAVRAAGPGMMLAIRGISDLLDGKSASDEAGGQPAAAANASAFSFELLDMATRLGVLRPGPGDEREGAAGLGEESTLELAISLYETGPTERDIWRRAGGEVASLALTGRGRDDWRRAMEELRNGGGGSTISMNSLMAAMREDFPNNPDLNGSIS